VRLLSALGLFVNETSLFALCVLQMKLLSAPGRFANEASRSIICVFANEASAPGRFAPKAMQGGAGDTRRIPTMPIVLLQQLK
jgi:hypothetical protein